MSFFQLHSLSVLWGALTLISLMFSYTLKHSTLILYIFSCEEFLSMLFLNSLLMSELKLAILALLIKIAVVPLHIWILPVFYSFNKYNLVLFLTLIKVLPLNLIALLKPQFKLLFSSMMLLSSLFLFFALSEFHMLLFSSSTMNWLLILCSDLSFVLFIILLIFYSSFLFTSLKSDSMKLEATTLNTLLGFPLLMSFLIKLVVFKSDFSGELLLIILSFIVSAASYLNMMNKIVLSHNFSFNITKTWSLTLFLSVLLISLVWEFSVLA